MKIKSIIKQHRRDFSAILICDHCENEQILNDGYDDNNYHNNVIPKIKCNYCERIAGRCYKPRSTKYSATFII